MEERSITAKGVKLYHYTLCNVMMEDCGKA